MPCLASVRIALHIEIFKGPINIRLHSSVWSGRRAPMTHVSGSGQHFPWDPDEIKRERLCDMFIIRVKALQILDCYFLRRAFICHSHMLCF